MSTCITEVLWARLNSASFTRWRTQASLGRWGISKLWADSKSGLWKVWYFWTDEPAKISRKMGEGYCAHILVRRMFKSSDKVKAQKAIVVCSTNPFSVTKDLFPQLLAVLPRRQFSAPNPLRIIASTKESCLVQVYSLVKDFASNGRSLQACKEPITLP